MRILVIVSEVYSRHLEVSPYLWQLHRRIEKLIESQTHAVLITDKKDLLKLDLFVIKSLFINALIFEDHLLLTDEDSSSVT